MEASAIPAPAALARPSRIGGHLLRLRKDEQLVALFRAGEEDAFRVIHDRYHARLFAYARQMLPGSRQDAEDALQDVFLRAYSGLRSGRREVLLRPWLYRVAHNRCIDELRRPRTLSAPAEVLELMRAPDADPLAEAERRESLRRLVADVRRLPEHQRSALLMRELGGMAYGEIAEALSTTVPAVKSLLVRARVGLARMAEARDTACCAIREELSVAHDRGVKASGLARRHMQECPSCRAFRGSLRELRREFAAFAPALGLTGLVAELLGLGGGGGGAVGAGGAVTAGGAAAASGAAGISGAAIASSGIATGHIATLLAAAAVATGGAVELQHTIASGPSHPAHARSVVAAAVAPAELPADVAEGPASDSLESTGIKLVTQPVTRATRAAVSATALLATSPARSGIASNGAAVDMPAAGSVDALDPSANVPPLASATGSPSPGATAQPTGGTTAPAAAGRGTGEPVGAAGSSVSGGAAGSSSTAGPGGAGTAGASASAGASGAGSGASTGAAGAPGATGATGTSNGSATSSTGQTGAGQSTSGTSTGSGSGGTGASATSGPAGNQTGVSPSPPPSTSGAGSGGSSPGDAGSRR